MKRYSNPNPDTSSDFVSQITMTWGLCLCSLLFKWSRISLCQLLSKNAQLNAEENQQITPELPSQWISLTENNQLSIAYGSAKKLPPFGCLFSEVFLKQFFCSILISKCVCEIQKVVGKHVWSLSKTCF